MDSEAENSTHGDETIYKLSPDELFNFSIWMRNNNYSLKTLKEYCMNIKNLILPHNTISVPNVKEYLTKGNNLVKRSALKLFLIYLEDTHNIVLSHFRYPRITKNKKPIEVISLESFERIQAVIRPEFKEMIEVMYFGGLRVKEAISIKTNDIDWIKWFNNPKDYGDLRIVKGKWNKERIVPLKPSLMYKLYAKAPKRKEDNTIISDQYMFNFKFRLYRYRKRRKGFPEDVIELRYTHKVYRHFLNCLNEASMQIIGKKIKTHMLRSSRATHLDEKGIRPTTIQYLLGHDNLATTSRYIYNTPEKVKKDIMSLDN